MPCLRNNKVALSLMELLVVTAIIWAVLLAAYAVLSNGLKVYHRGSAVLAEEDIVVFFDKFSRDINNTLKLKKINFLGTPQAVEFASLVGGKGPGAATPGKIIYRYYPGERIVRKIQADYSQVYQGQEGPAGQALKEVNSLKFSYYRFDEKRKDFFWSDECLEGTPPLAVKVELEFNDNGSPGNFSRTASIH